MTNESSSTDLILPGGRNQGEGPGEWFLRVFDLGWVPACGGTERWTMYRDGVERLYVVDMAAQKTGYLDRNDIVSPTLPDFDGVKKNPPNLLKRFGGFLYTAPEPA